MKLLHVELTGQGKGGIFWVIVIVLLLAVACRDGASMVQVTPDVPVATDSAIRLPASTGASDAGDLSPTATPATLPSSVVEIPVGPTASAAGNAQVLEAGDALIAFYSERDGNAEIYTMRPDGSDQRRLTNNEYDDYSPVWSPDGGQLAYLSEKDDPDAGKCFPACIFQIYLMDADGSGGRRLVETEFAVHHPDWHPDGTMLSFDTEANLQGDVYVVSADGTGMRVLIEDGFWADWSPDGTQIAFASKRDGNVEIYVADADGRNQRRVTENTALDYFPDWAPDGRRIAFTKREEGQLYVINQDGSDERRLTNKGLSEDPAWSPDGSQIIFQTNRDGNFELYLLNVDDALQGKEDAAERRLTNSVTGDFWPSWRAATSAE